jgi:phosphatidylglycerophosphate synthase
MKKILMTFPNFLTVLRFILGFVLFAIAWFGKENIFIGVLIGAFFLDLIDGPIARWTHQVSELGSRLDSLADFSVYMAFIVGAWWLWPEIILREIIYVTLLALSIVVPVLIGYIKFSKATSYHTWLVKFAVACMAPSSIILFIGGPAWPFQIASIISVIAGLEEILVTFYLSEPRSDVRSIIHLMRKKKDLD